MRSSRRALRELERIELATKGELPINLVPMIDILTVLVLYLLVATVYRHFSILQLNLPSTAPVTEITETPPLQLTVTIRQNALELSDRLGALSRMDNAGGAYNVAGLTQMLLEIKQRAPEETEINLLVEPDIPYETLVQIIDAVRLWPGGVAGAAGTNDLFPTISIGDAPEAGTS